MLATVKGDVHDIGKNLVDIILTNNGYEVHNLGIKCPIGDMVAKAEEVEADAIGMSGLLVKSTLIMRDNLEELNGTGCRTTRCCSAVPRSHAPTSSATCARSTKAGSSTGATRSRASARWSASWQLKRTRRGRPRLRARADRPRAARAARLGRR